MVFYGYHGVFPDEKTQGQRFEVDLEFCFETDPEQWKDELQETISYVDVYAAIQKIVQEEKTFNLLESLGDRIVTVIQRNFPVERIVARIRKPSVRMQGLLDYVEVEVEWNR